MDIIPVSSHRWHETNDSRRYVWQRCAEFRKTGRSQSYVLPYRYSSRIVIPNHRRTFESQIFRKIISLSFSLSLFSLSRSRTRDIWDPADGATCTNTSVTLSSAWTGRINRVVVAFIITLGGTVYTSAKTTMCYGPSYMRFFFYIIL